MSKDNEDEFEVPEFHRDHDLDQKGVSQVIIERFVKYRLPMLLQIKEDVDAGRKLTDGDLEIMTRVVNRAHQINRFAHTYPENQELVARVISLVGEITAGALENEAATMQDTQP